jgi:hypothetical protein
MMMGSLPTVIAIGATLRGNEYGWTIPAFPNAIAEAEARGYACLGGQFQFRLDDGSICEMYWLSVDSKDRLEVNHGKTIHAAPVRKFSKNFMSIS